MPTEYGGDETTPNTVQGLGPQGRELSVTEKLRLQRLTGQDEDPAAPRKSGFMHGVDPEYPGLRTGVEPIIDIELPK